MSAQQSERSPRILVVPDNPPGHHGVWIDAN